MVQPCSITWWPTVTLSPIVSGTPGSACSTERSWTLLLRPMRMRLGVAADHGAEPDAGVLAQLDVADHLGAVGDPGAFGRAAAPCRRVRRWPCECSCVCKTRIVGMQPRASRPGGACACADPRAQGGRERAPLVATPRPAPRSMRRARIDEPTRPACPGRPDAAAARVRHARCRGARRFTPEGRAALLHAIAHIEFNAINLALDAAWRFAGMPAAYYRDWLRVAAEEAHALQPAARAPADAGLRLRRLSRPRRPVDHVREDTRDDVVARMALVPRTLEARGLDATPLIQAKLRQAARPTRCAVEILDIILRDEVGHVAIGNHWYRWLCERSGLDPVAHYRRAGRALRGAAAQAAVQLEARTRAGFSDEELRFARRRAVSCLHSALMPAARMMRPLASHSLAISRSKSAALPPVGSLSVDLSLAAQFRAGKRLVDLGVVAVDESGRRASRREDAEARGQVGRRIAQFGQASAPLGRLGRRAGPPTSSARSLPDSTCGAGSDRR